MGPARWPLRSWHACGLALLALLLVSGTRLAKTGECRARAGGKNSESLENFPDSLLNRRSDSQAVTSGSGSLRGRHLLSDEQLVLLSLPGQNPADADPLVQYHREKASSETWRTPFMRTQGIDPLALESCRALAPGFQPEVLRLRDSFGPIRSLDDLRALSREKGQRVMVVAPRFGLGNTLRNWVSSYFWSLISGRRVVILHGGKFHGVYASLCEAFDCDFDHIYSRNDSEGLLKEFETTVPHELVTQENARKSIWGDDPVIFSFSYAFWDHWWLNNRTLSFCTCAAIGGCKGGGGGPRSKALHALISGGPSKALGETIEDVLRRHAPEESSLKLPLVAGALEAASSGLAMQFDVGVHIRTRASKLERPDRPFGGCRGQQCEDMATQEVAKFRDMYFKGKTWDCIDKFLNRVASLRGKENMRALSIFLATDNEILRPDFVKRLAPYGAVYYNGAEVAHVGVSKLHHKGRLPTMAEFYLLGKSHVILELDGYLSTFSHFAALFGNGSLLSIPYTINDLTRCEHPQAAQRGLWSRNDPRRSSNEMFLIDR